MDGERNVSIVSVVSRGDDVLRVLDTNVRKMSVINPDLAEQNKNARSATEREHNMTVKECLRLYPKAVAFSLIFSTAIIMEGYDTALLGSFWGFKPFRNRFGDQIDISPNASPGDRVVSSKWQTSVGAATSCGQILGLYLNGWISDKIGYKKTMFGSLILMSAMIFIPFFSQNIETFLVGAIFQGIPWGVFQTLTTTYASEVAPVKIRAYLTTYVNLCWVIGQLLAAGILKGFLARDDHWAYKIPFAIQWVWPPLILIGVIYAPESPWWLVRKGRLEDAEKSLLRLTSKGSGVDFNVHDQVMMMKATNELEMAISSGTQYWDCFRGTDLRRTEIASVAWLAQAFCGAALIGFAVQVYQRAGLADSNAFSLNIGQSAMGAVGTILSWFLMQYAGRRTIYLWGLGTMFVILVIIAGLGFAGENDAGASWGVGSLLMVYTFVYDLTVGPVCYCLVAEIPSTRLKIKTVVLARNFYNIGGIINSALVPAMLGVHAWNWGPRSGLFWAGCCFLLWVWSYFRLPEPKGRTYGELDVLFEHKVSARKFASTKVDQFAGEHTNIFQIDSDDNSTKKYIGQYEEREKQGV
ncbi:probable maltose permease [Rhynchosporium graminicola]|uniref:Probable maltose permease n=1 Tax=Rhynchosporium graminicola TaxID=2792576 RepID=A0A1E1LJW6_9HELO|nr:probable maltose permease [Rhynchosporium commune]